MLFLEGDECTSVGISMPSIDATLAEDVDADRRCERSNELFLPPSIGGGEFGRLNALNADLGEAFRSNRGVSGAIPNAASPHRLMVLVGE